MLHRGHDARVRRQLGRREGLDRNGGGRLGILRRHLRRRHGHTLCCVAAAGRRHGVSLLPLLVLARRCGCLIGWCSFFGSARRLGRRLTRGGRALALIRLPRGTLAIRDQRVEEAQLLGLLLRLGLVSLGLRASTLGTLRTLGTLGTLPATAALSRRRCLCRRLRRLRRLLGQPRRLPLLLLLP